MTLADRLPLRQPPRQRQRQRLLLRQPLRLRLRLRLRQRLLLPQQQRSRRPWLPLLRPPLLAP